MSIRAKNNSHNNAKESAVVKKYRRKLEKQMASDNKLINETTLNEAKKAMEQWIDRHHSGRINLRNKTISLFDGNKHSAPIESADILKFLETLENQFATEKRSLKGRISPPNVDLEG